MTSSSNDALQARVEALERGLEDLRAEQDILKTLYGYAHALDYGLEAEFFDCFTADGSWRVKARDGSIDREFVGREGLTEFFTAHTHAPVLYHKHLVVEPKIVHDANSATTTSYYLRFDGTDGGDPYLSSFGRYLDTFTRCPDGKWRIEERRVEVEHWVHDVSKPGPARSNANWSDQVASSRPSQ